VPVLNGLDPAYSDTLDHAVCLEIESALEDALRGS
jgi:hypothetical protein